MKKYIRIPKKFAWLCAAVSLLAVLIDFITKRLVMTYMELGESIPLIRGVLQLTYITNDGAAFGAFSEHRWVFMVLSTVLLVLILFLALCWEEGNALFYIGASLVFGGGVGNMIDRIAYGTVVDFIDFCAFPTLWKWIFNGADAFVCVGGALLLVYYITVEIFARRALRSKDERIPSSSVDMADRDFYDTK